MSLENNQVQSPQVNAELVVAQCQETIYKLTMENIMLKAMLEQNKRNESQRESDN